MKPFTSVGLLSAAIIFVALFSACTVAQAQEQKTSPKTDASAKSSDTSAAGNTENGKKLFMSNGCYECHGTVGQGSTSTGGARIGPPSISLEEMVQYVRRPTGEMPPYTDKVISDQNLADIYAYLKSQPKPQPAKNIPLLNQ
jgi:mono/diheme cytochrome c family protein